MKALASWLELGLPASSPNPVCVFQAARLLAGALHAALCRPRRFFSSHTLFPACTSAVPVQLQSTVRLRGDGAFAGSLGAGAWSQRRAGSPAAEATVSRGSSRKKLARARCAAMAMMLRQRDT